MIGFCTSGCNIGAKWSTLYTEIPKAMATGDFELRPNSMALQIQHDASGKVTCVLYADKDGKHQVQKARDRLRRGKLHREPALVAELRLEHVQGRDGPIRRVRSAATICDTRPSTCMQPSISRSTGTGESTRPGSCAARPGTIPRAVSPVAIIWKYLASDCPSPLTSVVPGGWGRKVTNLVEQYDHMVAVWTCGEDLPQADARASPWTT